MQNKELSKKIVSGMKWKLYERVFIQILNAATPMVLARILMPENFGTVAILTVFISLANTLVNNGLCSAIIQKKDSDNLDCSTVFYIQFIISVICYLVLFLIAPLVGRLYSDYSLVSMLRVLSLTVVIGSLYSMQITVMKKNMQFKKSFLINVSAVIVYGIVGICLAYRGLGCWSLVWANIANSVTIAIVSTLRIRWFPSLKFSFSRLKSLFSYSWKLTVGWLVGTLYQDVYTLIIGKRFSTATLGFYNRATSFPQIIYKTGTEVVDGVMFPALSKLQNDMTQIREITRNMLSLSAYILFPIFLGLGAVSDNLICVLLTEKWLPASNMMKILCVTYTLNSINNSNMHVFNSLGRSDLFLKFELIKRSVSVVLVILVSFISIYAVICVMLLMAVLSNIMNGYQNNKILGYTYRQLLSDIIPSFLCAGFMAFCVTTIGYIDISQYLLLPIQILCGVIIYIILSFCFKLKAFTQVELIIKNKMGKKQ